MDNDGGVVTFRFDHKRQSLSHSATDEEMNHRSPLRLLRVGSIATKFDGIKDMLLIGWMVPIANETYFVGGNSEWEKLLIL